MTAQGMRGPLMGRRRVIASRATTARPTLLEKVLGLVTSGLTGFARPAAAAPEAAQPYVGEILPWTASWVPLGWAACNGQLLPIQTYSSLFSLLGTTYGGDGQTTFALPDLRGCLPMHESLTQPLGARAGEETATLLTSEMPAHSHPVLASSAAGSSSVPTGLHSARNAAGGLHYGPGADAFLAPEAVGAAGGSQPHNNMQPYLAIQFIIALDGIYPSRN